MKPCARGCLVYEGIWTCGYSSGYSDVGTGLSCGCNPKNACYCDESYAASASSYISSCVSGGGGTEFPREVTSVLSLYDAYCATANLLVESTTTTSRSSTAKGSSVVSSIVEETGKPPESSTATKGLPVAKTETSSRPSNTGATETRAPDVSEEKKGLGSSDVIALGVGLGVGVPSLLLALATFWVTKRNKRQKAADVQANHSDVQLLHGPEILYYR